MNKEIKTKTKELLSLYKKCTVKADKYKIQNEIVELNYGLIRFFVKKAINSKFGKVMSPGDLENITVIGMIEGIRSITKYDNDVSFGTCAFNWILKEFTREYLRSFNIVIPEFVYDLKRKIDKISKGEEVDITEKEKIFIDNLSYTKIHNLDNLFNPTSYDEIVNQRSRKLFRQIDFKYNQKVKKIEDNKDFYKLLNEALDELERTKKIKSYHKEIFLDYYFGNNGGKMTFRELAEKHNDSTYQNIQTKVVRIIKLLKNNKELKDLWFDK